MSVIHDIDLENARLVICLGPGGVGKTTIAASLALNAAHAGRRVDAMTIDPAPRLLDALNLSPNSSMPQAIDLDGLAGSSGRLRAMCLDPQRTFDDLVARYAPSEAARNLISNGRIYQNLARSLAGIADYMAIERMVGLSRAEDADLIVLDTPPARAAIAFLDAPARMQNLIGSRAITLLGASRGALSGAFSLLDVAARAVLAAFDRLTGLHLLADVQTFVSNFEGMYEGFGARAAEAAELMRADHTHLLLITTADTERVRDTLRFVDEIQRRRLRVDAVVVNRLMPPLPPHSEIDSAKVSATLKRKLHRNLDDLASLKQREEGALKTLREGLSPEIAILGVTDLGHEPCSLKDLLAVLDSLAAI